jgi:predicted nucleotidyltransferase component of viral defense system
MIGKILSEKIREYHPANAMEQENILQEIMQQYILANLSRKGFFRKAAFHGGTCLRILHGLNRFSEDLDFILIKPDRKFQWTEYASSVRSDMEKEGIALETQDKSEADVAVKKAFLKTDRLGEILELGLPFSRRDLRKIRIKLEIDTRPPSGSTFETGYLSFPRVAAITIMTLESAFASKSHALLCRDYTKGRDWYDFWWYVTKKVRINYKLLQNALYQTGPWAGQKIRLTPDWYVDEISRRIKNINWKKAAEDVMRFLPLKEMENIELWSSDFFLYHAGRLRETLRGKY